MPSPFVETGERKIRNNLLSKCLWTVYLFVFWSSIHQCIYLFVHPSISFFPLYIFHSSLQSSSFCTFVLSIHFTTYLTINLLAHLFICSFILLPIYHLFLFLSVYFSFGTHIGLVIIHNFLCYVALGFGLSSGLR